MNPSGKPRVDMHCALGGNGGDGRDSALTRGVRNTCINVGYCPAIANGSLCLE